VPAVLEKSVALIGAGAVAREWLDILPEFPELALRAAVEPDAERRAAFPGRGFASVTELLASGLMPHVALVCTPPSLHLELCEPLLRAGVDVLIEPPLATTPADADRIAALAERADRCVVTSGRLRAAPALRAAREAIAAGSVGRLCAIEIALGEKRDARSGWRSDPALSGGGVWMELGADALDAAELLAGPVRRIRMSESQARQHGDVEDEVRVETEHDGGLLGILRLSWNEASVQPIARCIGDRGELSVGRAQSVLRRENGDEAVIGQGQYAGAERVAALDAFLCERRRRERRVDPGAQTLAWLHAAYRSLASRRFELA
jgi:predicted dehydrogenase